MRLKRASLREQTLRLFPYSVLPAGLSYSRNVLFDSLKIFLAAFPAGFPLAHTRRRRTSQMGFRVAARCYRHSSLAAPRDSVQRRWI